MEEKIRGIRIHPVGDVPEPPIPGVKQVPKRREIRYSVAKRVFEIRTGSGDTLEFTQDFLDAVKDRADRWHSYSETVDALMLMRSEKK